MCSCVHVLIGQCPPMPGGGRSKTRPRTRVRFPGGGATGGVGSPGKLCPPPLAGFWVHPAPTAVFPLSASRVSLAVQTCSPFILGVLPPASFFIIADKGWAWGTSTPAGASAGLPD